MKKKKKYARVCWSPIEQGLLFHKIYDLLRDQQKPVSLARMFKEAQRAELPVNRRRNSLTISLLRKLSEWPRFAKNLVEYPGHPFKVRLASNDATLPDAVDVESPPSVETASTVSLDPKTFCKGMDLQDMERAPKSEYDGGDYGDAMGKLLGEYMLALLKPTFARVAELEDTVFLMQKHSEQMFVSLQNDARALQEIVMEAGLTDSLPARPVASTGGPLSPGAPKKRVALFGVLPSAFKRACLDIPWLTLLRPDIAAEKGLPTVDGALAFASYTSDRDLDHLKRVYGKLFAVSSASTYKALCRDITHWFPEPEKK